MRIIVADDHPLYLDAIAMQLERMDRDAEVCRATSNNAALKLLAEAPADLVPLDISTPEKGGAECVSPHARRSRRSATSRPA